MRNPLIKRLPRELLKDIIKYIIMFFFLALPIGICSGYMIGNDSMIRTYNEGVEKYILEDGHFITESKMSSESIFNIEEKEDIKIYNLFYNYHQSLICYFLDIIYLMLFHFYFGEYYLYEYNIY